jgi:hypothetical protein
VELAMFEKLCIFNGIARITLVLAFCFCALNASCIFSFERSEVFVSVATNARLA